MAWRVWSCDTQTGRKQSLVQVASNSWENVLNGQGSGSSVFQLGTGKVVNIRALVEPVRRTLVTEWDGEPVYAGIIWDWSYDIGTRVLTVNHADLWSILSLRLVSSINATGMQTEKIVHASRTLWDLARKTVEVAISGGPKYSLPIVFQGGGPGTHSREYFGYQMPEALASLRAVMETSGGPDVVLDPRWSSDGSSLEWLMWDGTDPGSPLEFNLSAPKSALFDVNVKYDARDLANVVVGTGEGTERRLLVKSAVDASSIYPALVRVENFSQEKKETVLQQRTDAALTKVKKPVEQWSASMHAGATQRVTFLKVGRSFRVHTKGDPMIPDGVRSLRLVQYSGDLTETVKLQFQPI